MAIATTWISNGFTDIAQMRFGMGRAMDAKNAIGGLEALKAPGSLLAQLGVTPAQLQRLGVHHMTAKSFLMGSQSQSWRGMLNVSKQLSTNLTSSSAAKAMIDSVRNGWAGFSSQFPQLAKGAGNAAAAARGAVSGAAGAAQGAVNAAKSGGFFSGMFSSIGSIGSSLKAAAGPILGPLSKFAAPVLNAFKSIGNVMRMIPGLNIAFAVIDTVKAVTTLFDPNKSWGEKLSCLGKAALSIGAALPIPGASLLGGVRGAWAVGEGVHNLATR